MNFPILEYFNYFTIYKIACDLLIIKEDQFMVIEYD